jgi:hypothetical protein
MLLRVGWHLAVRVFLIGIALESHLKPIGQDLPGGGTLALVWSYGEALDLVGSLP